MRLEGKVALITGATKGIGRATARMFANQGAKVVFTGRTTDLGNNVESEIRADGGEAVFVNADVGIEADVQRSIAVAIEQFGKLTTLVNNAAAVQLVGTPDKGDSQVTDMKNDIFDELMRVNLYGTMWCCKHAIPEMIRCGGGSIINISSNVAVRGTSNMDGYTATKGAMNALTRSIAVEYARKSVRVNAISVGFVQSGPDSEAFASNPATRKYLEAVIRTPYFGVPDDIAHGAVYLASDESRYVTGSTLTIDGGASA